MGAQFVLLQDGSVWSKGRNGKGSLGDGSTSDRSAWAKIPSLSAVTQIAAGGESAYALLSDGTVRAWGANQSGQLGDGTQMDRSTPVTVLASSNTPLTGVTQITAGYSTAHALLNDGSVRSWGDNQYGQLATGNNNSSTFPVAAQVAFDPGTPGSGSSTPLTGVTQIAAGRYTIVARTTDGTVRAWGYNVDGAVGDGTFGQGLDRYRAVLVRIATPQDTTVTNPLKNVAAVAAGSFCMYAILTDKSVVAWGRNQSYALGTGQSGDRSAVAVPAPDLVDIVEVTGGREYGVARKTDGTILTWGANYSGQLGNGSMTTQTQPTAVTNQQLLGQKVVTLGISTLAFAVFLITA
jgi:alpha-tubulin suppressor-like RCC1 family protein